MPAPPYSVRFIQQLGLTGDATFVVPAGQVAIARELDAYCDATGLVDLFLEGAAGQAIYLHHWSVGDKLSVQWQGRQVYNAGETIRISVSVGSFDAVDVTLSGYLLLAPP